MSQQYLVAFIILFLAIANCFILQIAYHKWYRRKIEYQVEALARGENINEGFYYKISTICIRIPPLRERKEDIVDLIQFFLEKAQKENNIRIDTIEDKAWQFLVNYEYPGNLWELENTLDRMVVLSSNNTITGEGIPILFNIKRPQVNREIGLEFPDHLMTWKEFKSVSEKRFLESVLLGMGWNISATAKKLNMSSRQIFNKIKEYNIEKPVI